MNSMALMISIFVGGVVLSPAIFAVLAGIYDLVSDQMGWETDDYD